MKKVTILIADDFAVCRAGLRMLINGQRDMRVVGEAVDGNEAVRKARQLRPIVVLMELAMPEAGRMKAISETVRACPDARVLVLTIYDDPAYARAALAAGAAGYVAKKISRSELLAAIRAVNRGRAFVNVSLTAKRLPARGRFTAAGRTAPLPVPPRHPLSAREQQVLVLLARGYTSREIAERIRVGVKTAETYRSRIAEKLGLLRRADIVAYALETGLLASEKPVPRVAN
jgi:two-component system response regulator NreC